MSKSKLIKSKSIVSIKSSILNLFQSPLSRRIPDEIYLMIMFLLRMRKTLNIKNPKTFNEKIQWLKLYDRKSIYTNTVDKYLAKEYVGNIIGKEHIIPIIGIYNSFEEIKFDALAAYASA